MIGFFVRSTEVTEIDCQFKRSYLVRGLTFVRKDSGLLRRGSSSSIVICALMKRISSHVDWHITLNLEPTSSGNPGQPDTVIYAYLKGSPSFGVAHNFEHQTSNLEH